VGQRFSDFPNNPPPAVERLSMPSYTLLDLRAGVRVDDWNFSLFAQNVTDRLAVLSIAPQDGLGFSGINNGVVQRPRTIGIAVSKSY
jgi:outer membrane receptor protein involved in Fe transport